MLNNKKAMLIRLFKYLIIGHIFLALVGCSKKIQPSFQDLIVYPSPPDTARIQYLTSFSTSQDVEGNASSFKKFVVGEEQPKPIIKPYGVSLHGNKIYICDLDLRGLEIIDMKNQTFSYFTPKGLGQLKLPINCFVDSLGYIYVADAQRLQIVVFNKELEYVNSFGAKENFKPTDVFVSNSKIWVANLINGTIDVYKNDSTYQFLYSFPEKDLEEGKLFQPTNLFVTQDKVYVSDFGEFNIKVYNHEGKYLNKIGSYGKNIGQFARPKGIAVDKEDKIYVVDAAFENVQIFNEEGQLLMFFGGSYKGSGDMWLPAKVAIGYEGLENFEKYVDDRYNLKYVILVTNNFGPDKVNVYGYVEEK